jgi:hypothetical protein
MLHPNIPMKQNKVNYDVGSHPAESVTDTL